MLVLLICATIRATILSDKLWTTIQIFIPILDYQAIFA